MNRFRNILAVHDGGPGSDDVLVQSVALARANGARLTVVRPQPGERALGMADEARRHLGRLVPWIVQEGVGEATTDVLVGTPHVEVIRRVLRDEHDLVVVGAAGGTSLRELFSGKLATHLLHQCPCAVWLLKPAQAVPCANVVAAVDATDAESGNDDINDKILDFATAVARGEEAFLHVIHFWEVDGTDGERLKTELPRGARRRILDTHETARRRSLHALIARHASSAIPHEVHLPRGRPHWNLAEKAGALAADVIVMGAPGHGASARLFGASVTETVLGEVRCSVLAVKPDGFRTPVSLSDGRAAAAH